MLERTWYLEVTATIIKQQDQTAYWVDQSWANSITKRAHRQVQQRTRWLAATTQKDDYGPCWCSQRIADTTVDDTRSVNDHRLAWQWQEQLARLSATTSNSDRRSASEHQLIKAATEGKYWGKRITTNIIAAIVRSNTESSRTVARVN